MNLLLITLYSVITAATVTLFFLIIRYLNDKPFGRQFVSDRLSIGLLVSVLLSIVFLSSAVILRELAGPFSSSMSWAVLALQQFLQLVFVVSLFSLQVAQFCNVFFISRLSEWSEETVLRIHRGCILTVSLVLTFVYCKRGNGICRAQPMLFYLNDSWQETIFRRDLISLCLLLFLIVSVSVLQICIELKRRKVRIDTENAAKAAEDARRNLEEARLRMELTQRCKGSLPSQNQLRRSVTFTVESEERRNNNNALKFARAVALFAVLPVLVFLVLFSLETIGDWRPHGVTISMMLTFGVVVPAILFVQNSKLRKFASSYFKNFFLKFLAAYKPTRVAPLIDVIS